MQANRSSQVLFTSSHDLADISACSGKTRLILDENLIQQSVFSVLDGQLVGSGFVIDREGYALTAAHLINKTVGSVNIVSRTLGITRAQLIGVDQKPGLGPP